MRRLRSTFIAPTLGLIALGSLSVLSAQTLVESALATVNTGMRNYGLISFGNATFTNYGDTWGPLAVEGNLTLSGSGSIAQQPGKFGLTSDPTLYVGGQLNLSSDAKLESGYASTPNITGSWSWDGTQKRLTGSNGMLSTSNTSDPLGAVDPRTNAGPSNWNWLNLKTSFENASATLAAATSTGTISISGQNLVFSANGQTSGVVVFTLDMAKFNGTLYDADGNGSWDQNNERVSNVSFNISDDVNYVVNVINANGKTIFDGINFNSGTNTDQLLWNITPDANPGIDSVSLGGGARFYGSVLAVDINLSNSGNVAPEGQLVTNNYTHSNAELHFESYSPIGATGFTPVPEPGSWGVSAIGVAFLTMAQRRRRRSSTPPTSVEIA